MSATASPPKPRPSGPRPGERAMPWQCAHCRWQRTAFYQNAGVDLTKCPKCKATSLYIIGDLRELPRYSEELRYIATRKEPETTGNPSAPLDPKRRPATSGDEDVARLIDAPRQAESQATWRKRLDSADVVEAFAFVMLAVAIVACFA